jgi:hypothetical protein
MTNEEKAKTLVDGLGIIYTDCNRVTIKKLLIKMAEWKDEQFEQERQQWIDKAWDWLTNQKGERTKEDFIKAIKGE